MKTALARTGAADQEAGVCEPRLAPKRDAHSALCLPPPPREAGRDRQHGRPLAPPTNSGRKTVKPADPLRMPWPWHPCGCRGPGTPAPSENRNPPAAPSAASPPQRPPHRGGGHPPRRPWPPPATTTPATRRMVRRRGWTGSNGGRREASRRRGARRPPPAADRSRLRACVCVVLWLIPCRVRRSRRAAGGGRGPPLRPGRASWLAAVCTAVHFYCGKRACG